jgi:hypothetical protein
LREARSKLSTSMLTLDVASCAVAAVVMAHLGVLAALIAPWRRGVDRGAERCERPYPQPSPQRRTISATWGAEAFDCPPSISSRQASSALHPALSAL